MCPLVAIFFLVIFFWTLVKPCFLNEHIYDDDDDNNNVSDSINIAGATAT